MRNITIYLLGALLLSSALKAKAQICAYEVSPDSVKVSFTAFKTKKKVGVNGEFTSSKILSTSEKSINDVILNSVVLVDTSSLTTKDKGRDIKIINFFFKNFLETPNIKGIVKSIDSKKSTLVVSFYMNGQIKDTTMKYKITGDGFEAKGNINILDWKASKSFEAINRACSVKHEGKTWPDVDIRIESKFNKIGC